MIHMCLSYYYCFFFIFIIKQPRTICAVNFYTIRYYYYLACLSNAALESDPIRIASIVQLTTSESIMPPREYGDVLVTSSRSKNFINTDRTRLI